MTLTYLLYSVNDNIIKNAEFEVHWSYKLFEKLILAKDMESFRTRR